MPQPSTHSTTEHSTPLRQTADRAEACVQLLDRIELKLPFWRYHDLYSASEYSFLLDSAKTDRTKADSPLGQFSFLGGDPWQVYRARRQPGWPPQGGAQIEITRLRSADGQALERPVVERRIADPFDDLRATLAGAAPRDPADNALPLPFTAGAVGYFGYEAAHCIEALPETGGDDLSLPDILFMFVDVILGHSHVTGESYLSIIGRGPTEQVARQRAHRLGQTMRDRIRVFEDAPPPEWRSPTVSQGAAADSRTIEVHALSDEQAYCRAVEKVKAHIHAGDIFEGCLTHRFDSPLVGGTAWELYQELRQVNPAPFASFLNFPEAQVVSSSPERFVSLNAQGMAESRPIKGTRPRGQTPQQDAALRHDLFSSVKDRAENVMIVDLVRSDFGRVSKLHSVQVPELMAIEEYATVFQMVSTIRGELKAGLDGLDLVRATFPGGSMTGAPKIEAMKIIDRLEPVKRGIYSGAIGYLDYGGTLDLSIVIRTFVIRDGRCYYNVGGAVVADSDPRAEYQETLDKARALKLALANLKSQGETRFPSGRG